ncbi:aminoacyl-tRNA hydrolase [Breznakiella homolactica]|uniref:Peptidyl-tRNA hydrolase n=1 Tax=Breznakiella homolactica TaxID=2798577 RepID=A0A7T7XMZ1_9SPIR|nr:aminoacyl-tRNA hydrolase [Breznakiella homolactica]QQO09237.1 aminoacyl-tRNA hydrolase [Breznakiella homolactica]
MIELVAFLGNYGRQYAGNRHNAGWLLAERLPFYSSLSWKEKFKGVYASLDGFRLSSWDTASDTETAGTAPDKIYFLMPHTFMNLSGDSVQAAASFFRIQPDRILAVHDELELPLGTASFKFSGGLGGHNGLRSMKSRLGTADFWRLRIGIGRPDHHDISSWVLSDFAPQEEPVLDQVLDQSSRALTEALIRGPETLLPEWNKKKIAP